MIRFQVTWESRHHLPVPSAARLDPAFKVIRSVGDQVRKRCNLIFTSHLRQAVSSAYSSTSITQEQLPAGNLPTPLHQLDQIPSYHPLFSVMGNNPSSQLVDKHRYSEKKEKVLVHASRTTEKTHLGWRPDIKDPLVASSLGDVKERIPEPKPREPTDKEKETPVIRHLIFCRNGFQVYIPPEHNGGSEFAGEVMLYENPSSEKILRELNAGYVIS